MRKYLDEHTQTHQQVAPAMPRGEAFGILADIAFDGEQSELRFPPTRAARASRSRGVFLEQPGEIVSGGHSRWIEALGALAAVVVTALALAVCVNTTSVSPSASLGANPGPAIVAAASVAPTFVLPIQLR